MDVKILVIDPDEPDEPLYEIRVDAGTDDPDKAGELAILAAAGELAGRHPGSPVVLRPTCQCGTAFSDEPGHESDTGGGATCQDLTAADVAATSWPAAARFRPLS